MANRLLILLPLFSFLLLLLFLATLVSANSLIASIDCGASDSSTDDQGITWVGDTSYIKNGESKVVKNADSSIPEVMRTLRVFRSRKKNCYPIGVKAGNRILVRVSFHYGNYDDKSLPPKFALQFDGNSWDEVLTLMNNFVWYEMVYVASGDKTSVCVAQTEENQPPFVSAIEVRELEMGMYAHVDSSFALCLRQRLAFGVSSTVRYPDDAFDRIWFPATGNGLANIRKVSNLEYESVLDKPPNTVLLNASATAAGSSGMLLSTGLPSLALPIYINFYFAEVTQQSSTDKRTVQVYMDGIQKYQATLINWKMFEYSIYNMSATGNTKFLLRATADSTLPPLINAMEVFTLTDALATGTNSSDVKAMAVLQNKFEVLQDWNGDPCLPPSYNWDWVGCSSDKTPPRVTALYLSGFELKGELPDFSTMDALETINLSNNSLSGGIPDFLGTLPNLKELNLSENNFSGPLPASLTENKKVDLMTTGNPNLCPSDEPCENKKKGLNLGLILGLVIPLSTVVTTVATLFTICKDTKQIVNESRGFIKRAEDFTASKFCCKGKAAQGPAKGEDGKENKSEEKDRGQPKAVGQEGPKAEV